MLSTLDGYIGWMFSTSEGIQYNGQWRGGSDAVRETFQLMPPPPVILLLSFGLGCVSCRRHSMQRPSVIEQYIRVDVGATSPQQFHGSVLVEVQRICILRYLILGLILPNNRWMVMHFFMCIAVQSHRKILKVQSFQFSSFLSEKNEHVL